MCEKAGENDTGVVGTGNARQTAEKQKKLMKKLAVGIVNYAHPSAGGLAVLRAVRRSRRQALASSGEAGFRPDLGPSRFSRCPAPRERMEHLF
jgi:hypothetical protein